MSETAAPHVQSSTFGLYYPFIHFRDDAWLKLSALYWPKMMRLVAPTYERRDSDTVRMLADELDFVASVDPAPAALDICDEFTKLIHKLRVDRSLSARLAPNLTETAPIDETLVPRALIDESVSAFGNAEDGERYVRPEWGSAMAALHVSEFDERLVRAAVEAGFASYARRNPQFGADPVANSPYSLGLWQHGLQWHVRRNHDWVIMNAELAWAYKMRLSQRVIELNGGRLALNTDQTETHALSLGLTSDELTLGALGHRDLEASVATTFGMLSLRAVAPKDLASVPIEKIIRLRKEHGAAFDRWREDADLTAKAIASGLTGTESPELLNALVQDAVRTHQTQPMQDLRSALRDVKLDAVELAANTKIELPLAVTSAVGASAAAQLPWPVTAGAGFAFAAFTVARSASASKSGRFRQTPVDYLFQVKQGLNEQTLVRRVQDCVARAFERSGA